MVAGVCAAGLVAGFDFPNPAIQQNHRPGGGTPEPREATEGEPAKPVTSAAEGQRVDRPGAGGQNLASVSGPKTRLPP